MKDINSNVISCLFKAKEIKFLFNKRINDSLKLKLRLNKRIKTRDINVKLIIYNIIIIIIKLFLIFYLIKIINFYPQHHSHSRISNSP